ncbi:MAG: peptide ABC transporter substrate-binding protein [Sedimentisphaerales bacterium]|nr:peptide ABC transporter substrate-binding protein [Sedimentisphaerales bacterium]
MYRLSAILLVLSTMVLVGMWALQEKPLPEGDFVFSLGDSIKTLDPAQMSWNEDIRMSLRLWEGLTSYHPETLEPIEGAAVLPAEVSADGRRYVFELRENGRWSNGDAVKAADFVRGWRRAIEPGTAMDYSFLITDYIAGAKEYCQWRNNAVRVLTLLRDLENARATEAEKVIEAEDYEYLRGLELEGFAVDEPDWEAIAERFRGEHLAAMEKRFAEVGIKALDERHLEVQLVRPTAYFLNLLSFSTFMPVHESIELLQEREDGTVTDLTLLVYDPQWVKPDYHRNGYPGLITNGAYWLSDWQFKRYMYLEANEYYWDRARVKCRTLLGRIMREANTAFLAYERGEVDMLTDIDRLDFAPSLIEQGRSGRRDDIHAVTALAVNFYNFNCLKKRQDGSVNPLGDARVRMALNLAVNKQELVDKVKKLGNPPARNLVPPGSIKGYFCPAGPDYNPARGRELLAEAGYPAGRGLGTIEILYNTGQLHELPAQAIAEMWRENLNIDVVLRGKELKTYADDKQNHRYMVARASWYGDYNDPTTFLDTLVTGNGNNDSGFSCVEYDELMRQAAECTDQEERFEILARAEKLVMHELMPVMPLYFEVNLLAFRPEIKGIWPNARNVFPSKFIYKE